MTVRSDPPSPRQLHQSVHMGLMRCNATRFGDANAVTSVAEALDRWVSEYPDQARDIEHLSLSACYTATKSHQPRAAAQLGSAGLIASLIRPKPAAQDRASAVMLTLLTAEAHLAAGQLREGQVLLDDAGHALRDPASLEALTPYLIQRFELLSGTFSETALENADAAPHFGRAIDVGEPLLRNRIRLRSLGRQWVPMVFGTAPELLPNGDEQAAELLKDDVLQIYRRAMLGYARTAADRAAAARAAADAFIEFGLPGDASTLELRPALLALPLPDASRFDALLDRVDKLDSPRRQAVWRAVIRLARGRVQFSAGDTQAMLAAHMESKTDLARGGDALTWGGAIADILGTSAPTEQTVRMFLMTYGQVLSGDPVSTLSLPLRVQFDEAIGAASGWAFDELQAHQSADASRALSVILDALRSPEVDELPFAVAGTSPDRTLDGQMKAAYEAALDRLGRVQYAMSQLSDSCAVVLQSVGDEVLFAAATGAVDKPLVVARADHRFVKAAQSLARGLADAMRDPDLDTTKRVEDLGRNAFQSLPVDIQSLLRGRRTIYLVSDFWADREGIPFELFHDGSSFLGLSRVLARSLSLRELVRAVEPPVVHLEQYRRAICVAVPRAEGLAPLEYAEAEVQNVRTVLEQAGWEAPDASAARLDPFRLLEAVERAGVTHIAAHGKAYAGGEALILGDHDTLTVADINERPRRLGGLVFLNACSLGQVRYLGAGVRNGIASAFVRAGAPCVIANLLPIEDWSASELAREFYGAARDHPTGESLRLARKALADRGVRPSRWGTTLLFGDPQFSIADAVSSADTHEAAAHMLYSYSLPDPSQTDASDSMIAALRIFEQAPQHTRLRGALDWVRAAASIDTDAPAESTLAAARVARALDCRPGEALFLYSAALKITEPEQLRRTLDQAIWALEPLAPLNRVWYQLHLEASARRQKLDARRELPFIDGPVHVNDPGDPATQAILQIQHALDRQQVRRHGPLRLRRPERTIADVAWNAIVVGQQNRFESEDAQAACAAQTASKLVELELLQEESAHDVRRVLGGLLSFLWESQRITHLEPERAEGQAGTLRLMIERIGSGWDAGTRAAVAAVEDAVNELGGLSSEVNRFQRALDALNAPASAHQDSDIGPCIRAALDRCGEISVHARAEAAAWSAGVLLERAYEYRRTRPPRIDLRERLLSAYRSLGPDMEGWLWPYLMDGYKAARETSFDFIDRWVYKLDARA